MKSCFSVKAEGAMVSSASRRCPTRLHLLPSDKYCPRYAFRKSCADIGPTSVSAPRIALASMSGRCQDFRHAIHNLTNRPREVGREVGTTCGRSHLDLYWPDGNKGRRVGHLLDELDTIVPSASAEKQLFIAESAGQQQPIIFRVCHVPSKA